MRRSESNQSGLLADMGASNVKSVYANWAHLRDGPFRLLVYMALVAKDADPVPRYWGGREASAIALGRLNRINSDGRSAEEVSRAQGAANLAVKRGIRALRAAGAITSLNVPGPGRRAEYRLNLDGPPEATQLAPVRSGENAPQATGPEPGEESVRDIPLPDGSGQGAPTHPTPAGPGQLTNPAEAIAAMRAGLAQRRMPT